MELNSDFRRKPNPRKRANCISILTYAYTFSTFRTGFQRELQEEDITDHLNEHSSRKLGCNLEESWKYELKHYESPSLWRAIWRIFGIKFALLGLIIMIIELVVKISQPIALSQLIAYYTDPNHRVSREKAIIYASMIVAASLLQVLLGHFYMINLLHFGMKLRVALCSVIYRKTLRLSKSVLGGTTIGQLVNLLSNDVNRCDRAVNHAHQLWIVPLETVIVLVLLNHFLGIVSTIGVFFLVMLVPLQMYLGKKTSVYRLKTAMKTDERVRLMNEIISGIQVIKMYTWEKPFANLVAIVRKCEIKYIRYTCYIRGILMSFTTFSVSFALFLAILTYVLLGNTPKAEYVFVITSFYSILRQSMTKQFPRGITETAELRVSISRIQKFLFFEEVEATKVISPSQVNLTGKNTLIINGSNEKIKLKARANISIKNVSAKWISSYPENTLENINFHAKSGELVAVIGPVGSGKTSLLHTILKELPIIKGSLDVEGTISYAAQEPWLFSGSIKQNIIFGQQFRLKRYNQVLRVCALQQDLQLLPHGDETLIGERGTLLSGGQKARVNLARAVYKEADIYILDDPLSAVDTEVGKQLFNTCIAGYLKDKCTILVTHQLQYLHNVHQIFLLEKGTIVAQGTYRQIRLAGRRFSKQLTKVDKAEEGKYIENDENVAITENEQQFQIKEHRSEGHVSGMVYSSYLKAGGSILKGVLIMSLFIFAQAAVNLNDYFLTFWVNQEQDKKETGMEDKGLPSDNTYEYLSRNTCLYIYSTIVSITLILALVRSLSFFRYCMTASTNLHNDMFLNIVHAPMQFFHTNNSGRILNRFSKDMGSIDEVIPIVATDFFQCSLAILGVTVMISLVNPWLLIATALIILIFTMLRIIYMRTSRSIIRLEAVTRSPVFSHLSASLQGLTTIRAFGAQEILQKEFDGQQDLHSSVWFLLLSCSRAFAFYMDLVCVMYIGLVTFSFFMNQNDEYGGNVGLAITQAISITGTFQWGMRQWTELENQMTSVERVVEYTKLGQEDSPQEVFPPNNWPQNGAVDFKSVSLRYSLSHPYVLKNLNFSVNSSEKIGIVGRTGAGKSSILFALFQLAKTEGVIEIDGLDVTKMPIHDLRSKISIIPQEPVLFSGSLRKNLDPFEEYPDHDIWNALEEVELKEAIRDLPGGLNQHVSEGGSNFSVGQRQLLCLARAIIRKNKILVLDEATANVDPQTDILIQKTIREKFVGCTVLTIAHRLNTIMDSNKVLVMSDGEAVEFDCPAALLENKKGHFYSMVHQTGSAMALQLTQIANENHQRQLKRQ